jgi:hypothetical protein
MSTSFDKQRSNNYLVYMALYLEIKKHSTSHLVLNNDHLFSCSYTFKDDGEVGTITDNIGHRILSTVKKETLLII